MPSGHSAELPHLPCSSRPRPELPLSRFLPGLLDQLLPLGLSPLLGLPGRLLQSVLSGLPLRLLLSDPSLPPDPALLSLQPDLPDLLLRLLLLLPPGPALLPLQLGLPGLLLRLLRLDQSLLPDLALPSLHPRP